MASCYVDYDSQESGLLAFWLVVVFKENAIVTAEIWSYYTAAVKAAQKLRGTYNGKGYQTFILKPAAKMITSAERKRLTRELYKFKEKS